MQQAITTPLPVLLILATLLAAAGLWLLIAARRRRVGDTPHCSRCSYEVADNDRTRCPECGHEPGRHGHRVGRPSPSALGTILGALIVLATLPVFAVAVLRAAQYDYFPHAPMSVVLIGAERGDQRAVAELDARIAAGVTNAEASAISALCARRIAVLWPRSDTSAPESVLPWSNRFETLQRQGLLTKPDYAAFLNEAIRNSLRARPEVRLGDPVTPMVFTAGAFENTSRIFPPPTNPPVRLGFEQQPIRLAINAIELEPRLYRDNRSWFQLKDAPAQGGHGGTGWQLDTADWIDAGLTPGDHTLEIDVRVVVHETLSIASQQLYEAVRTLTTPITILPPDAEMPSRFRDDIQLAREFWAGFGLYGEGDGVRMRHSYRGSDTVVLGHSVRVIVDGAAVDDFGPTLNRKVTATQDAGSFPGHSTYFQFGTPGETYDVVILPNEWAHSDEVEPGILAYGLRLEGLPVQAASPQWGALYPRPERLVLLDRDGNDIEELPIVDDGSWAPPVPDTPAEESP